MKRDADEMLEVVLPPSSEGQDQEKQLIDSVHRIGIDQVEIQKSEEKIIDKLNHESADTKYIDCLCSMQDEMVVLRVGNIDFYTCRSTIKDVVNMDLAADRNPQYFTFILDYLRSREYASIGIDQSNLDQLIGISKEAKFFKLDALKLHVDNLISTHHLHECKEYEEINDRFIKSRVGKEEFIKSIHSINTDLEKSRETAQLLAKQLHEKYQNFVNNSLEGDFSVNLNISGQLFTLPFSALATHDDFLVTKYIKSNNFKLNGDGQIFIDRSPELFRLIHGYILSHGKFNHFPRKMSKEKKDQLSKEADYFGLKDMVEKYLDPCRYPIELLSPENIALKEREDKLREIFVKDPNNEMLQDPYLFLSPLFEIRDIIQSKDKFKINFSDCPKLLDLCDSTTYSKQSTKTCLVSNLGTFLQNFEHHTKRLLEGLDWSGVLVAGGSVLGCCLKELLSPENTSLVTEPTTLHKDKVDRSDEEYSDEQQFHVIGASFRKSFFECRKGNMYRLEYFNKNMKRTNKNNISTLPITDNARQVSDPNIPHAFKKSDIDLFLYAMSEEEAEEKIKHIYLVIKKNLSVLISTDTRYKRYEKEWSYDKKPNTQVQGQCEEPVEKYINDDVLIVRTNFAVTFYMYRIPPIQVVLRIYKSPAEILLGFDVDCCTVGFDGSHVWCTDRAIRALSHKVNIVDVDRQSTTYTYRLLKYAKRGFSTAVPGYHHSKVKNQYLHYPRRVICSHLEDKLEGLAKLILYDFACRSKNPKNILGGYYDNESLRTKQLNLTKNLVIQESDYLDLTVFKYDRKTPKELDSVLRSQVDSNGKFLIHSINNLVYILNASDSLDKSDVPNRIKWITLDPSTQKVGSFNPTTKNFYKDAYQQVHPKDLILIDDLRFDSKELSIAKWYKSVRNIEDLPENLRTVFNTGTNYRNLREVEFQIYPADISNKIEKLFRQFIFQGSPIVVDISPFESLDFIQWKVVYSSDHPLYPNSSDLLHRQLDGGQEEPLDYEDIREGSEDLPEDCTIVKGLSRKSFY